MDLSHSDMGPQKGSDTGHGHFVNSTGEEENFKQQRHATLPFLKIDIRHHDQYFFKPSFTER